ncbi:MAG: hypothetical protein JNN08_14840, partial [Bryobacterales bacterium]|nr:hypothetical protein [Bryobacterales bacterium]
MLIFSVQQGHVWHEQSIAAIERLLTANEAVYLLPQNIAEFWNVCTRPTGKNGLGLTPQETADRMKGLDAILSVLHDTPEVYTRWRRLLVDHAVKGIQVHDARIAAAMQVGPGGAGEPVDVIGHEAIGQQGEGAVGEMGMGELEVDGAVRRGEKNLLVV